jgi:F0F1-type ATP synthase assembly protein I
MTEEEFARLKQEILNEIVIDRRTRWDCISTIASTLVDGIVLGVVGGIIVSYIFNRQS